MDRRCSDDEPVTPAGRLFLHPKMQQVINCIIGMKQPIDIDAMKLEIENTLVKRHPRFSSILIRDSHGREHWRRVEQVDMDKHVVLVPEEEERSGGHAFVNDYVADLTVSTPLDLGKPLWEVHVLRSNRCCVLRLHHALGDGISLMSLFLSCCKRVDEPDLSPTLPGGKSSAKPARGKPLLARVWTALLVLWYTLVYVVDFLLHSLWVRDETTPISGGEGVELWPRRLATVTFSLADMKLVKNAVNGTINDVLFGIISLALGRYLEQRNSIKLAKPLRITGLAMVNTRQTPGLQDLQNMMTNSKIRWGNQFGFILLPLYLHKGINDPLKHVRAAKEMLDSKKLSLEAPFSYKAGSLVMSLLGPEVATMINYRIIANTTFTISNVLGPSEEIMFAENPVSYIRTTSNGLPHAITMHMVSYTDKADMQILVAKDIIPDLGILVKHFEDSLANMKAFILNQEKKEI